MTNRFWEIKSIFNLTHNKARTRAGFIFYLLEGKGQKEHKININQDIIIKSFWVKLKNYVVPEEMKKPLMNWLKKYYKDLFNENKKQTTKLNRELVLLQNKKEKLLDLKLNDVISDWEYKKRKADFITEEIIIKEKLWNIINADDSIIEEASNLVELLSKLDFMRKIWNKEKKLKL
jgi:hypothetical protein